MDDPTGYRYQFNENVYKNNCPVGTLPDTKTNPTFSSVTLCKCDKEYGFWYIDDSNQKNYLVCSLGNCPSEKKYLIENTNQCVHSCDEPDVDLYTLRYKCLDQCPEKTEVIQNTKHCQYTSLSVATNTNELYEMIQENVIGYYDESEGSFEYNDKGVSTQIVGVSKNAEEDKGLIMKDNLTYIDLSNCIDKIYEFNALDEDDELIELKFDVTNNKYARNAYFINPVEYEIYSYKTGKKVDISICGRNEIMISYPITDVLNSERLRLLKDSNQTALSSFKELFKRGKKLNDQDSKIDTFNIDNEVYTDLCQDCVINGKDLVLKDRPNYLYPLKASLCENNCTYAYTDYKLERVNCYCSYKKILDFDRVHKLTDSSVDIDVVNDNQKGPSNFAVLNCFKNISVKNNGLFYFVAIILLVLLTLLILGYCPGLSVLKKYIYESVNESLKDDRVYENQKTRNQNPVTTESKRPQYASSERNFNEEENNVSNPPPKNDADEENDDDDLKEKNAEYIPEQYDHLFFSEKDNGVTKKVRRGKIPFKVQDTTKFLYQKLDAEKLNDPNIKRNVVKILEDVRPKKKKKEKENKNVSQQNNDAKDNENIETININQPEEKLDFNTNNNDNNNINTDINNVNTNNNINTDANNINTNNNINTDENNVNTNNNININTNNINNNINRESSNNININNINESRKMSSNVAFQNKPSRLNLVTRYKRNMQNYMTGYEKKFIHPPPQRRNIDNNYREKNTHNEEAFLDLIKQENYNKSLSYEDALVRDKEGAGMIILTFIIGKIYFIKLFLLRKKYDIFSHHAANYLLYHVLVLSFITMFFDIKTLSKIFFENNYPSLAFYLLYGFICNILAWIIFKIMSCLIKNNAKINNQIVDFYYILTNNPIKNENDDNIKEIDTKIDKLISDIKVKLIIFNVIEFIIFIFCFLYLWLFGSVYKGSKKLVLKTYGISLAEIFLIRLVYAIILGSLRRLSLSKSSRRLYNVIQFMDLFLS